MWLGDHHLDRQASQPAPYLEVLATLPERIHALLDKAGRPLEILGAEGMLYGLVEETVLLVPRAGPFVQRRYPLWLRLTQSLAQ